MQEWIRVVSVKRGVLCVGMDEGCECEESNGHVDTQTWHSYI